MQGRPDDPRWTVDIGLDTAGQQAAFSRNRCAYRDGDSDLQGNTSVEASRRNADRDSNARSDDRTGDAARQRTCGVVQPLLQTNGGRLASELQDATAQAECDRVGATVSTQLLNDILDVGFGRFPGDC